ncbi:LacI family DNA-binding transcriptional regulator [Micromonospora sp. WMMD1082]|uniref:LacI family DNA-binding transcriptional regulator n=1 Tax=Micromonospora sp. WMMD1082 TaxID=3016104 RepID=UPI002416E95F|nr:LacI family DNA-binding transcriptional regulator [Micromonospora sp. WMMD1082]MDG4797617.1 LacI family DNA-binding transcriptional regulator [Micromonospora sp. WMMD1082]
MVRSRPSQPTLADVARAAGVSTATASRALNGTGPVSAPVRERVRRIAADLSYVPNPLAVSLARRRGHRVVIGVVATHAQMLTDQYVARLVGAAAREADAHGLGVSTRWLRPGDVTPVADAARDRGVHGLLLVNHSLQLLDAVPVALRGRVAVVGPGFGRVAAHDVDTRAAMHASLRHLIDGGRRRIAMLTGPGWVPSMRQPVAAYRASMREHGLPVRTVTGGLSLETGAAGARRVLRSWPDTDAIVAITDVTALGALRELADSGRRVPDDVAVVGFDDVPLAALGRPALTTGTHPVERIAAGALRCLLDGTAAAEAEVVHPSTLVPRQSA